MKKLLKSFFSLFTFRNNKHLADASEVKNYYENWTERYIQGFQNIFQSKKANTDNELVEYFCKQMQVENKMHLLDAGCGVCGPAILIAQQYDVKIDAVTISETQAKISQEKILEVNLQNKISVHCEDFHDLTFLENEEYDIVYFMESLVHSNKPYVVIDEAYKKLKPDGIIYIKDLFEKTAYSKEELKGINYWVDYNNKKICLNIIKKEELLMILRNLGFQLEFCKLMEIPTNQDMGNRFVVENEIMPDPIINSLPPYLEWYEIKAIKPGPNIIFKM